MAILDCSKVVVEENTSVLKGEVVKMYGELTNIYESVGLIHRIVCCYWVFRGVERLADGEADDIKSESPKLVGNFKISQEINVFTLEQDSLDIM